MSAEFDLARVAKQTVELTKLANELHSERGAHELETSVSAFRAELDGDRDLGATLRGRLRADTGEDLAMLTAVFLSGILRRNRRLVDACVAGVEALAAEAREV